MSDYNAPAQVYSVGLPTPGLHQPMIPTPVYIGTVAECVRLVIAKKHDYPETYYITVPLEAGFIKDKLDYQDIKAISNRSDFPKA